MSRLLVELGGKRHSKELNWGLTRLGRASDNDIVIDHPSISSYHCQFELGLESLTVRDCESTNGTFINDQRVQEAQLESGQRIRVGQVPALVEWANAQIVVPEIKAPRPIQSESLGNGVMSCRNHPGVASIWICAKCRQYFCIDCARGVNLVGRPMLKLCPLCSGQVELAPWADGRAKKQSIWGRVKRVFNRTIRME